MTTNKVTRTSLYILGAVFIFSLLLLSPQSDLSAQTGTSGSGAQFQTIPVPPVPTKGLPTDLGSLISDIFVWSLRIAGIAVFVMVFYAGFIWVTAAGNTGRVSEAKSKITNAAIGAVLLFSSYLILYTINPDLVNGAFTLPGIVGYHPTAPPTAPVP